MSGLGVREFATDTGVGLLGITQTAVSLERKVRTSNDEDTFEVNRRGHIAVPATANQLGRSGKLAV
jgi:hypothetical protein